MRLKSWPISALLLFSSLTLPAAAQQPAADDEPVRAALRKLIPMYEQTVNTDNVDPDKDNLDQLKPYLAPEFSAVMVTSREVKNFDELREFFHDIKANYIGKGGKYNVKVNAQPSVILGDIAVTRGTADETVTSSRGNVFTYTTEWTAVLRKMPGVAESDPAGQWRMVRLHASMDPVYNDFANLRARGAGWVAGGVAGVIGIVVGVVLALLIKKARRKPADA